MCLVSNATGITSIRSPNQELSSNYYTLSSLHGNIIFISSKHFIKHLMSNPFFPKLARKFYGLIPFLYVSLLHNNIKTHPIHFIYYQFPRTPKFSNQTLGSIPIMHLTIQSTIHYNPTTNNIFELRDYLNESQRWKDEVDDLVAPPNHATQPLENEGNKFQQLKTNKNGEIRWMEEEEKEQDDRVEKK